MDKAEERLRPAFIASLALRALAERVEEAVVRQAREQEMTWEQIAVALQVRRQGIHKKYAKTKPLGGRPHSEFDQVVVEAARLANEEPGNVQFKIAPRHLLKAMMSVPRIRKVLQEVGVTEAKLTPELRDEEGLSALGISLARVRKSFDRLFGVEAWQPPRPALRSARLLDPPALARTTAYRNLVDGAMDIVVASSKESLLRPKLGRRAELWLLGMTSRRNRASDFLDRIGVDVARLRERTEELLAT